VESDGSARAFYRVRLERSAPDAFTAQIMVDESAAPRTDDVLAPAVVNLLGDLLLELAREGMA